MSRFVVLAINSFNHIENKTGNMLIRYMKDEVVAIIDPEKKGLTSNDVIQIGGDIPVVGSFNDAKKYNPDHLVIGNAPQGGIVSNQMLIEIKEAIRNSVNIVSGMHEFLSKDIHLQKLAEQFDSKIIDLRMPPSPPSFSKGSWRKRNIPVLLVVGTDCDTGKMTTAWEIKTRLSDLNKKVKFIGTGQTGILLSDGIAIDAIISDFMSGEIENLIDTKVENDTDLIIVEGQGALSNYAYSGVTLGLMHGCMPDYLILTHDPSRSKDVMGHKIPDIKELMQLHIDLMSPFKRSSFIGINLLTFEMGENIAKNTINEFESLYKLPTTDLIRFGDSNLIKSIYNLI
ncbi:MAG: DUF1611 domain-containing protein [Candidatus Neomarinimicrobiota bacterium]